MSDTLDDLYAAEDQIDQLSALICRFLAEPEGDDMHWLRVHAEYQLEVCAARAATVNGT